MRYRYETPFGANLVGDGRARFALWAPDAENVELVLQDEVMPMNRGEGGLFETEAEAAHGDLYRYRVDGGQVVPDPASRYQPEDVHGPSMVVDPTGFEWGDERWSGRPWEETVLHELHVGTFSLAGTYAGAEARLDYLAELGVTAVQIMPLSDFPGGRNWGYDGVLPYDSSYGTPEDLKSLVSAAHARGVQVFLDVLYNHLGPQGNYLYVYAKRFFTERHETPWGAAVNYDGEGSTFVRGFFAHNAPYWLEEYRFDGLRFDAPRSSLRVASRSPCSCLSKPPLTFPHPSASGPRYGSRRVGGLREDQASRHPDMHEPASPLRLPSSERVRS